MNQKIDVCGLRLKLAADRKSETISEFETGTQLFQAKQYDKAIAHFEQCLEQFDQPFDDEPLSEQDLASKTDKTSIELISKILVSRGLSLYNKNLSSTEPNKELFKKASNDFSLVPKYYHMYKRLYFSEKGYEYLLYKDREALNLFVSCLKAYYLEGTCWRQSEKRTELRSGVERTVLCFTQAIFMALDLKDHMDIVVNVNSCKAVLDQLPQYYMNRGLCYNEMKSYSKAITDFTSQLTELSLISSLAADKKEQQRYMTYHNIALSHMAMDKFEEAISDFSNCLECSSNYSKLLTDDKQKKYQQEKSIESHYQRAIACHKFITENVAECNSATYRKVIEFKKLASSDFEQVLSVKPNNYQCRLNYAQMLLTLARNSESVGESKNFYLEAISQLRKCLELKPKEIKLHMYLAKSLTKTNQASEDIIDVYKKIILLTEQEKSNVISDKQLANIYFERAVFYNRNLNNVEGAIADFTKCIALNNKFSDAYFNRGTLYYLKQKKFDLALDDFVRVVEINSRDVEALFEIAMVFVEQRKYEDAKKYLNQIIDLDPSNIHAQNYLHHIELNDDYSEENNVEFRYNLKDSDYELDTTIHQAPKTSSDTAFFNIFKKKENKKGMDSSNTSSSSLFYDDAFTPTSRAILGNRNKDMSTLELPPHITNLDTDVVWLKPKHIANVTNPSLYVEGTSYTDVTQGGLGNCWFMSAVTLVATYYALIEKIIVVDESEPAIGKYVFRFFKEGEWIDVYIDDYLPCDAKSKTLLFSRSSNPNEFWVSLLEKAYAKVYGSYSSLKGGHIKDALVDLTGGVPFSFEVDSSKLESLWQRLLSISKYNNTQTSSTFKLMGARTESSATDFTGLVNFHAYSILDVFEIPPHISPPGVRIRLVKLKNPWANAIEWKGDWCDSSPLWYPQLRQYVGNEFREDDGVFFMSLENFAVQWSIVEGVEVFDMTKWTEYVSHGHFDSNIRSDNNWLLDLLEEKQYLIENPYDDNRIVISLAQYDTRYTEDEKNEDSCIAMHLFAYDPKKFDGRNSSRIDKINKKDIIQQSEYKYEREVVLDHVLNKGYFISIPHEYFTSNCKHVIAGKYVVRILSQKKLNIYELSP